jgi:predicted RNA-binding protein
MLKTTAAGSNESLFHKIIQCENLVLNEDPKKGRDFRPKALSPNFFPNRIPLKRVKVNCNHIRFLDGVGTRGIVAPLEDI